jgi:hypothetical protein
MAPWKNALLSSGELLESPPRREGRAGGGAPWAESGMRACELAGGHMHASKH